MQIRRSGALSRAVGAKRAVQRRLAHLLWVEDLHLPPGQKPEIGRWGLAWRWHRRNARAARAYWTSVWGPALGPDTSGPSNGAENEFW